MVCHIVLWNLKEELTSAEKANAANRIQTELEALKDVVDGVVEIKVVTNPLETSNVDVMLYSKFETQQALQEYQAHPKHKETAKFIGSVATSRKCMDYIL